jgi:hypothetical protein
MGKRNKRNKKRNQEPLFENRKLQQEVDKVVFKVFGINVTIKTLVAFISGIAALSIPVLIQYRQEKVAEKSGDFDKGELVLSFAGYDVNEELNKHEIDVYYGIDFSDTSFHVVEFPVGVANKGNKTLEDVNLLLKYPHISRIAISDTIIKYKSPIDNKFSRKYTDGTRYDQVSFFIGDINPKTSSNTKEVIAAYKETKRSFPVEVYTKDSVKMTIDSKITFGYKIDVGVTSKDADPRTARLNVYYFNITNRDSLIAEVMNYKRVSKSKDTNTWKNNLCIIIPKIRDVIKTKEGNIKIMEQDNDGTIVGALSTSENSYLLTGENYKKVFFMKIE